MENTEKKSNIIVDFFMSFVYIFIYALKGIKFCILDMWVLLFNNLKHGLNTSAKANKNMDDNSDAEEIYQRTKNARIKKTRIYNYSPKTLEKYEQMKIALNNDLQASGATRSKTPNVYEFTVRNVKGNNQIFKGTMTGMSKLDINSFLVNEGYEVYDIHTSKFLNFVNNDNNSIFSNQISKKDLIFFLTQLSTYLKSGITLNDGMNILTTQTTKNKARHRAYKSICYELSLGESFSNALAKQGTLFPALLINMVKAAEATGTLQETLEDMGNYYTEVNNTQKEMKSALTYPAIITIFSIAVVTFIIVYVVPQFTKIYDQSGITISGLTAVLIHLSNFLSSNLVLLILLFVLVMFLVYVLYKKVKPFRIAVQKFSMKVPVIKDVIIYNEITIFAKTFASLLRNNVFITESMDILSRITSNEIYRAIMYKTIDNIVKGEKISDAFKDHWAVPDVAYYMIVTGESTGQLADMMQKVSDYYQVMHKNTVNTLKSFIEPVMIVLLALMVGAIIIAVIVPMFQLYNNIL